MCVATLPTCLIKLRSFLIHIHRLLISLVSTLFPDSTQTVDCGLGSHGSGRGKLIGATRNLFVCGLALPDADSKSLDAILHIEKQSDLGEMLRLRDVWLPKPDSGSLTYLSTEWTHIFGSLGNFELFDNLSECCTVPAAILSADSYLLCSLCHYYLIFNNK